MPSTPAKAKPTTLILATPIEMVEFCKVSEQEIKVTYRISGHRHGTSYRYAVDLARDIYRRLLRAGYRKW